MGKHWKDVKASIEAENDRIWFDEPEYITMSKMGVYPSGAGTQGQTLGNLFFPDRRYPGNGMVDH